MFDGWVLPSQRPCSSLPYLLPPFLPLPVLLPTPPPLSARQLPYPPSSPPLPLSGCDRGVIVPVMERVLGPYLRGGGAKAFNFSALSQVSAPAGRPLTGECSNHSFSCLSAIPSLDQVHGSQAAKNLATLPSPPQDLLPHLRSCLDPDQLHTFLPCSPPPQILLMTTL